ncbi:hypothetical protein WR25_19368 isoform B [Diploscapter pachys]|uniref:Uncharacterized protein n=1 Tax=Diploscapter pachys TaxID=2018661 RepID=A0A2A2KEK9_9BILA|nr:hypothetical protein WR25_19368 isoform A [Diploscapter pachys]PAV72414.1 hypothetical protein WR25_19368 isoform B [Diploscapter pachys]
MLNHLNNELIRLIVSRQELADTITLCRTTHRLRSIAGLPSSSHWPLIPIHGFKLKIVTTLAENKKFIDVILENIGRVVWNVSRNHENSQKFRTITLAQDEEPRFNAERAAYILNRLMTSIPRFNRYAFAFAAPNIQMTNLPDQIFTHINPQAINQLNLDDNGFSLPLLLFLTERANAAQPYIPSEAEYRDVDEKYLMPNKDILAHFLIFCLISYLFIFPSDVFQGVGLTLENWASSFLGPRETDIVRYQCRKIVVHRAFVGCLPFLFSLMLWLWHDYSIIFTMNPSRFIHYVAASSILFVLLSVAYFLYHRLTNFRFLPAMHTIQRYFPSVDDGADVISLEYIMRDTIKHKISNYSRIAFGQSWIVYYTNFSFQIFKKDDCKLRLEDAMDFNYFPESEVIQLITLVLEPPSSVGPPIKFKCVFYK